MSIQLPETHLNNHWCAIWIPWHHETFLESITSKLYSELPLPEPLSCSSQWGEKQSLWKSMSKLERDSYRYGFRFFHLKTSFKRFEYVKY